MAVKVKRNFFRYYTNFLSRGWGEGGEQWVADVPPIFDIVFLGGVLFILEVILLFKVVFIFEVLNA